MNDPAPPAYPLRPVERDPDEGRVFLVMASEPVGDELRPRALYLMEGGPDGDKRVKKRLAELQIDDEDGVHYHAYLVESPEAAEDYV